MKQVFAFLMVALFIVTPVAAREEIFGVGDKAPLLTVRRNVTFYRLQKPSEPPLGETMIGFMSVSPSPKTITFIGISLRLRVSLEVSISESWLCHLVSQCRTHLWGTLMFSTIRCW